MSLLSAFAELFPETLGHARVADSAGLSQWWGERERAFALRKLARPKHVAAGLKGAETRKGRGA